MSNPRISFVLQLIVYPFDIYFSFGETNKQVSKFLKKQGIDKEERDTVKFVDNGVGRCVMFGNNTSVIRLTKIPTEPRDFAHLQHEITHYVMFLLFHTMHMPHNLDTAEAYAYLTGYITEQVYKTLPTFEK